MQSNYVNKKFILFTGLIAVALCALPIMSMQLSGGESGKIVIYGYDLMEFSAWGCLPLLTPLLLTVILFGTQTRIAQEIELSVLFIGNILCCVHSYNTAQAWLMSLGENLIQFHTGIILYPLGFAICQVVTIVYTLSLQIKTKEVSTE